MYTKEKITLAGIALVLLIVVGFFGRAYLTGYQVVDGRVIATNYKPGGVSVGVGNVNGQPASVTSVQAEEYILIIDVNGRVDSYIVSAETYAKALGGQEIFKMNCNSSVCGVVE